MALKQIYRSVWMHMFPMFNKISDSFFTTSGKENKTCLQLVYFKMI